MLENIIIISLLLVIAGLIIFYLARAKKRGEHCIGCPYAKNCGGKCHQNFNSAKQNKENT